MKYRFGDGSIIEHETGTVNIDMNTFDQLEYECMDLIKSYCEEFGIKLETEFDDIDFYAAKQVQEAVLQLFKDAGIEFEY